MNYLQTLSGVIFILHTITVNIASSETNDASFQTPDEVLRAKFAYSTANSSDYVRAVRESLNVYSLNKQHSKHPRSKRAVKRVCYGELGCFEDSGPFSYLEMLPSAPEEINTKFYFYSTKQRSDRPLMELPFLNMTAAFRRGINEKNNIKRSLNTTLGGENGKNEDSTLFTTSSPTISKSPVTRRPTRKSLLKRQPMTIDDLSGFDELSVRVIVHGFGSACPHVWIYEMKTALMAVEDCIVICVDWENGATFPNYVRAAANTRLVGKQLAMLLQNLKEHKGLNLTRTHIIGFSLGAHVSGFAGAELPGLARITGLDPAGPLFEYQHPKVRLDSTDADFVDVIHSNGENLILGGLGSWQPMGDVDFYPNGGRVQTGCSNLFVGAVTDFIWSAQAAEDEEGRSLCNHRRAYKFFIDSVAPRCLFPAFPCANYDDFLKGDCFPCAQDEADLAEGVPRCGNMGYYADRSTGRGQLYLVTREEEPFCAHQFQLKIYNSFNDLPLRTIGRLEAILEGDGGLNETFTISEKDDSEFFAGDIVSKIIVPHPALGFPTTLSLRYKSYSGWLSKGLPHWDIDKVILIDSYGRSHSLCKPSTKLSSGTPVRMKLLSGDCELENQDEYGSYTTSAPPTATEVPDSSVQESMRDTQQTDEDEAADGIESVKQRKNIFNLGTSFRLSQNASGFPLTDSQTLPWQPILEGNSLDKEVGESSRSLPSAAAEQVEIFEPILKDRRLIVGDRGRNFEDSPVTEGTDMTAPEILEPVLRATTPRVKKAKEILFTESPTTVKRRGHSTPSHVHIKIKPLGDGNVTTDQPKAMLETQEDAMTVQLLPFRLGELLQRAERYARETLLPLISIQAPKFFGFGGTPTEASTAAELKSEPRKPRYIPRFEQSAFLNATELRKIKRELIKMKRKTRRQGGDTSTDAPAEQRNLFELLQAVTTTLAPPASVSRIENRRRSINDVTYYTNFMRDESRSMRPEEPEYQPVFIDLPTFRPPKSRSLNRKSKESTAT